MNELMLASKILDIAQLVAPYDTGNLAFNSITIERIPNGFRLTSHGNIAYYNVILEKGSIFFDDHQNWWSDGVAGAVSKYIGGYYNNNFNSENVNFRDLAEKSKDNPDRNNRFLQSIAR